jgi:hypothetical protein
MKKALLLLVVATLFLVPNSFAATVTWTDWTSATAGSTDTVIGNMGGITVTYTGDYSFVQTGTGTNYWTEPNPSDKPYTDNAVVDNAPTASELIALNAAVTTNTITFSSAVLNPIMAIVSMGQPRLTVTYDFDTAFTVLSTGQGYWGGTTSYTVNLSDYILSGNELHGVIQFSGLISQITWSSTSENWHGFTFGMTQVPEPATMLLLGFGLVGLAGLRRKLQK